MKQVRLSRVLAGCVLGAALCADLMAVETGAQAPVALPSAQPDSAQASSQAKPPTQLRVQVTIARYTEGKKTTSLPFTLWVTADEGATILNAGQSVRIPQTTFSSGGAAKSATSFSMTNVGTRITCRAMPSADGRFRLNLEIVDSYLTPAKTEDAIATLKSLETHNSLFLRDGQTAEFVASTDMVSGEVTRIEVTATTVK